MNAGPVGHEDPTPMGTPVPAGECPHCGGFLWIQLRGRAPIALPAGPGQPAPPPPACCTCPHCGEDIWFAIGRKAPVATSATRGETGLMRRGTTTKKMR